MGGRNVFRGFRNMRGYLTVVLVLLGFIPGVGWGVAGYFGRQSMILQRKVVTDNESGGG